MIKVEIKSRIAQVQRGELPKGYQHSHLYIVPEGWKIKRLGEVTQKTSRKNRNDRSYPACSINNQIGFILQSEQFEQGSYDFLDKTSYKIVEKDEFAYNPARINVGSIGRLKNMDKAIVSSLYVCFKLSDKNDATYFENWFNGYDFYKEIIRNLEGSVREYLFYENFSRIRMPVPPIAEQQKIAEILAQCDRVIVLKQELLYEKRRQKKWLMQRLLTGKIRLNGYAGKWKSASMQKLFLFGGAQPRKRSVPAERFQVIRSSKAGPVTALLNLYKERMLCRIIQYLMNARNRRIERSSSCKTWAIVMCRAQRQRKSEGGYSRCCSLT